MSAFDKQCLFFLECLGWRFSRPLFLIFLCHLYRKGVLLVALGGGGGAGGVGRMNSVENETGQYGGLGIDRVGTFIFNKTFSSSIGDNGWFAGGGGSAGGSMNTNYAYGNGGATLFGGGGNGDGIGRGINGINGTGGGGGGIRYSDTIPGGNGGSGIVLIRYKLDPSATNNKLLTMEPVVTSLVTPQRTPYIYTFKHKRGANTQEPYTISFDEDTLCDILIVGGGGSSGRTDGIVSQEPGGGGGQLVHRTPREDGEEVGCDQSPAEAGSRLVSLKRREPLELCGHFSDIRRAVALATTHAGRHEAHSQLEHSVD